MSTDIRASENGLWCPRHSSLFSSGVKFWQPSELGTFVRRPRKAFFWEEKEKKKWTKKEPNSPSSAQACYSKRERRTHPLLWHLICDNNSSQKQCDQTTVIFDTSLHDVYYIPFHTQLVARQKRCLWAI